MQRPALLVDRSGLSNEFIEETLLLGIGRCRIFRMPLRTNGPPCAGCFDSVNDSVRGCAHHRETIGNGVNRLVMNAVAAHWPVGAHCLGDERTRLDH